MLDIIGDKQYVIMVIMVIIIIMVVFINAFSWLSLATNNMSDGLPPQSSSLSVFVIIVIIVITVIIVIIMILVIIIIIVIDGNKQYVRPRLPSPASSLSWLSSLLPKHSAKKMFLNKLPRQ